MRTTLCTKHSDEGHASKLMAFKIKVQIIKFVSLSDFRAPPLKSDCMHRCPTTMHVLSPKNLMYSVCLAVHPSKSLELGLTTCGNFL